MAWVAFDRAVKSCEQFGLRGPVDRWRAIGQEIHDDVCRNGFDLHLGIDHHLIRDGFVQRYDTDRVDDGLPPGEGAFLPCSFWLADNYVLLDRYGDAEQLFEKLLRLQNDVGLLSEEYDSAEKRLVGNFPQAFSHVALVNMARKLSRHAEEDKVKPTGKSGLDRLQPLLATETEKRDEITSNPCPKPTL